MTGRKEYGLIGFPVEHSFSPLLFRDLFHDRPGSSYSLFPLPDLKPETFKRFLTEHPELQGFNVTAPYKKEIMQYLTALTPQARDVGAVNTVKVKLMSDGKRELIGHNTDVDGVIATLSEFPHHRKALILGTGGASNAVAVALRELGTEFVKVSRRKGPGVITYSDLSEDIVKTHTLIVNATPLGMYPSVSSMPDFPVSFLTSKHLLFDLIYNPSPTLLMEKAQEMGAQVVGGFIMLKAQAEAALRFWDSYSE